VAKQNLTGLFFGSFNPIHLGHLMIANYMVEYTEIGRVWFIVSPHNPLKEKATLLSDRQRLYMANLAVEDESRFQASNIEFHLPQPSYTIDTLTYISGKYPQRYFVLIAGSDTLPSLYKWKNYEELLRRYEFYIYPRPNSGPSVFDNHPHVHFTNAPLIDISSSFIRQSIREGRDVKHFLPEKVWEYIREMHFYEE
jgi:nicotinate-nucleotide adenylyltransferase